MKTQKYLRLITGLLLFALSAGMLASASSIPLPIVGGGLVAFGAIRYYVSNPGEFAGTLRTEINITDLLAEFGSYYIKNGANVQRIKTLIRQKSMTPMSATAILTEDTKYRASTAVMGEVIQAFQKAFTAKGDPKFLPEEYNLFNIKVDTEFYPDEIKASWLGFMASLTDVERANWPISRYIVEQLVIPRAKSDLELLAYYKGLYAAPAAGNPGNASQSMTGIRNLFNMGRVNSLPSGAITESNILDKIEAYVKSIPDAFASERMGIYMSPKLKMAYARDYRNTFGTNVTYNERKAVEVDFAPNYEIIELPSMNGTDDVWITPKVNFQYLRRTNGEAMPKIESAKRQVSIMMDWWEGFAFGIQEMIWLHKEDGSGSGS